MMPSARNPVAAPPAGSAPQLPALTSLRFFAAFAILVLHYRDLLGPLPPWVLKGVIGGQYGVTFFFVLSGFILTYNYHGWFSAGVSDGRYWRFQRLRVARIYPVYVLGLLLDTPWHVIERVQVGQLAEAGHSYWASWLLNLLGLQAWVPGVPYAMFWNAPAWSVSAEIFFYATFPFLCAALARRIVTQRGLVASFVAVVLVESLLYVALVYGLTYVAKVSAQTQYLLMVYTPLLHYGEFMAGCLAGLYFVRMRTMTRVLRSGWLESRRSRNLVIALSLAAVALRVWSSDYTGPSAMAWLLDVSLKYSIFILPFTAIILAIASGRTFLTPLLEHPWLVLLGEASYSLYIIHWAGQTFLRMGFLGAYGGPVVNGAVLLGTVAASLLCYRYFEVPWRRRLRGAS